MIELKTLRQLIKLMKDNELTELDLLDQEEQVTLKRAGGEPVVVAAPAVAVPAAASPPAAAAAPAAAPSGSAGGDADADAGLVPIKSPMVGTFYAAASPDSDAFVKVGSRVDKETVVCVVEAMKVFNEIKAETSGTVTRIVAGNGDVVEYGQPLFMIQPG